MWCPHFPCVSSFRAKEIKIKLGILLQKPDSVGDIVIPYNEKPEKPAKTHKWVMNMDSTHFLQRMAIFQVFSTIPHL